jgi:hypothetical protein
LGEVTYNESFHFFQKWIGFFVLGISIIIQTNRLLYGKNNKTQSSYSWTIKNETISINNNGKSLRKFIYNRLCKCTKGSVNKKHKANRLIKTMGTSHKRLVYALYSM